MGRALSWFAVIGAVVAGCALAFVAVTYDAMIHFGLLFVDYPNPNGHGLKGVTVSTPELLLKILAAAACFFVAYLIWTNDHKPVSV